MKVLAFDTSSKALSLAILEDKQVLAETTINIKKNHSITLMPAIDFLMEVWTGRPRIWTESWWQRGQVVTQVYESRSQRLRLWLIL